MPTGRKRYIKPAAAISSRTVFSPAPTQRESSISSEARSWRISEFDGLRFLQIRSFCSNRRQPALRSPQFLQKNQSGFLPIHRRRLHTDVLLCTRMQRRRFFCFSRSVSIQQHREHRHPTDVRPACPRSFCKLAPHRWCCCTRTSIKKTTCGCCMSTKPGRSKSPKPWRTV